MEFLDKKTLVMERRNKREKEKISDKIQMR